MADRVRYTGERDFQRDGNLLFHFLRGTPGEEGDHRDLGVGDIQGKLLDRQAAAKAAMPAPIKSSRPSDDIERLVQREMGNPLDHWVACFQAWRRA